MKKILSILLSALMTLSMVGCGDNTTNSNTETMATSSSEVNTTEEEIPDDSTEETQPEEEVIDEEINTEEENETDSKEQTDEASEEIENDKLNAQQMNSITMLNYLTVLAENIMISPNNRLVLEESYSTLYNNISPNSVDKETQNQITELMRTINSLQMNDTKRSRIQYLYDQGKAQAIRSAIPSPLAILNVVQSTDPLKNIVSVTALALNSYTGYKSAVSEAESQYLQSNWELEDNETVYLNNARINVFNYLMDIVRNNSLPGELALNSTDVETYLEKKNANNIDRSLQFLETNQETYKAYYGYWLFLADAYYQTGDYEKCLEAFNSFEDLDIKIFRKNHDLANVLPDIICAGREILSGDDLINFEEKYGKMLMDNASSSDWTLQYFAVQTYIDLYSKTNDLTYLQSAYTWTLTIIDELLDTQKEKNSEYLAELQLKDEKTGTKEEKNDAKEYNKILKENRKIELPPVYEPLLINCQLLFAIADKLNISSSEQSKIDRILHEKGEKLFLSDAIDNEFWMNSNSPYTYDMAIEKGLTKTELLISANILNSDSTIEVILNGVTYDDWKLKEVDRNGESEVTSFEASYQSETFKKAKFNNGDIIEVIITPCEGIEPISTTFIVNKGKLSTKFERQ